MIRLIAPTLLLICACNKDSKLNQSDCGAQGCPVGTSHAEYRVDREGFDLGAGADPTTYSGELAFSTFGESECAYQCVAIQACPEGTFPIITETCFNCGVITAEGDVSQGTCDNA